MTPEEKKRKRETKKKMHDLGVKALGEYREQHPEGPNHKHGGHAANTRKRYSDLRTSEGKHMRRVMQDLIQDLGPDLTAGQRILLDRVREKLMVLFQIGKYVDLQESLVTANAELLPCLGKNYLSYAESIRRDIEALAGLRRKLSPNSYASAMKELGEGEGKP